MDALKKTSGYTLLAMLILLMLLGFALSKIATNGSFSRQVELEQQARQSQILDHIKTSLISFAGSQGIHSQSHLGHLPCPADLPEQAPKTTCLQKPWGYLPAHSKTSVNYLNLGLNARNNELEPSARRHWQYAVSAQLLQANALGWSRWVDYTKPSMEVRIKAEDNRIQTGVAVVVAASVVSLGEHQYEISGPYLLMTVAELRHQMGQVQQHQIKDTVRSWVQADQSLPNPPASHENLHSKPDAENTYTPVNSNCNCRCTKTRCTCQCDQSGQWISAGSCFGTNTNCVELQGHSECTSSATQPCILTGPSQLKSQWPVSRFEPVAAANKSCRPASRNLCPLSKDSTACTCEFSWPENTRNDLGNFEVHIQQTAEVAIMQVQP